MKESDWKLFKQVKQNALERFCAEARSDIKTAMEEKTDSFHGQYLHVYKLRENADNRLSLIFDGSRRSIAVLQ